MAITHEEDIVLWPQTETTPTWPHCSRCDRPKELVGYPADFWTCAKGCDAPRNPIHPKELQRYNDLWSRGKE